MPYLVNGCAVYSVLNLRGHLVTHESDTESALQTVANHLFLRELFSNGGCHGASKLNMLRLVVERRALQVVSKPCSGSPRGRVVALSCWLALYQETCAHLLVARVLRMIGNQCAVIRVIKVLETNRSELNTPAVMTLTLSHANPHQVL